MYQEPKKLAELQLEFKTFVVISTRVKEDLEFFWTLLGVLLLSHFYP